MRVDGDRRYVPCVRVDDGSCVLCVCTCKWC
jgi:hypothetical protein